MLSVRPNEQPVLEGIFGAPEAGVPTPECRKSARKGRMFFRAGPKRRDALFDPSRVIQLEIQLDPKDWLALRISHPIYSEDGNQVIAPGYDYCRADIVMRSRSTNDSSIGILATRGAIFTRRLEVGSVWPA